ncbi:MAG: redox-regulated ATPase YchF [Bradymonadales bacterium]|nr:MAG: redox-regulated ATPase YchF [Bradymonadales bacterium]
MSLECGIVGLPNVGKSTLFNTLTRAQVPAENFPFCTVDPNRGVVEMPDPRMTQISEIVKPKKQVPTTVTFVDIAGLVKGASEGEGLGNQFLSHIRSVDAIAHVVRCFESSEITHVLGEVDPLRDVEIIDLELCMSDLDLVKKRIQRIEKLAKSGNAEARAELHFLELASAHLSQGKPLRKLSEISQYSEREQFVTAKPLLFVANLAESDYPVLGEKAKAWLQVLEQKAHEESAPLISMSISLENQLSQLKSDEDRSFFLEEYGISEPGLNRLIQTAYKLLGLLTFFTAGEKEVRAWTLERGQNAQAAAGRIHSDFARGFIRAEVTGFGDFLACGGEKGAREKGLLRAEGKEYIVQDGDIMHFRFNV